MVKEEKRDYLAPAILVNGGYWVKIQAKRVSSSAAIPHGVQYSLTLHDRNNIRIVRFDNAHAITQKGRKKFSGRKVTWDHKHRMEKVSPHEFESAGQLLDDYWTVVYIEVGG